MRVLFVGNSHTYFHDMPHTFARMCAALTGKQPEITMLAFSDRDLAWHREEYFSLRYALLYGHYDYCVLQQQAHPFPDETVTRYSVRRILKLCRTANTQPVLMMTWAPKNHPEQFAVMNQFYHLLAEETGAILVPIGDLFAQLLREHPEIDLYWKDGAHASAYGSYLIAAAFTAILCRTRDLSPLDCEAIDFQLDFQGEEGLPLALEQPAQARIQLEEEKANTLRICVEQMASFRFFTRFHDLNWNALHAVYRESSLENASEWYPELSTEQALEKYESGHRNYLLGTFRDERGILMLLEREGTYLCALRLYPQESGEYFLEALETHPNYRRQGWATRLLRAMTHYLQDTSPGSFVRSYVSKRNLASIQTHVAAGFRAAEDYVMEDGIRDGSRCCMLWRDTNGTGAS